MQLSIEIIFTKNLGKSFANLSVGGGGGGGIMARVLKKSIHLLRTFKENDIETNKYFKILD